MSEHKVTLSWRNTAPDFAPDFAKEQFSREHTWTFDGGLTIPASASPSVVPPPYSNPAAVDPEEAFVAAIASCHMLTFLWLAHKKRFQVGSYDDDAIGVMTKNERGVYWVSSVTLRPRIAYTGDKIPNRAQQERLHQLAHEQCFIAASVKTEVTVKMDED